MYENKYICSQCNGKCCSRLPGANYPEDFGLPDDTRKLLGSIRSGNYTIDWWEGDPREGQYELERAFFVRPACKGKEGIIYDPSWGGECTFLEDHGCSLQEDERPSCCKYLEPGATGNGDDCIIREERSKQNATIAWMPYGSILQDIAR